MTNNKHWLNYINGKWQDSKESLEVIDPSTDSLVGTIAVADSDQVKQAVEAANACVTRGDLTSCKPSVRANWLHQIGQEIRSMIEEYAPLATQENGKSLNDSKDELTEAAEYFEYYSGIADKIEGKSIPLGQDYIDFTIYEPHGVSAQIIPWNFPVSLTARSAAPALAAGNAVIAKSPELCPLASTMIAVACQKVGLPDGAFNLLCGHGASTGAQLIEHEDIHHIVFTGSVKTGQNIMRAAADRAIPSVMELGGKSAAVVFSDADMEQLIDSVRWGIFFNAGQVCSAMSRLIVEQTCYDDVVQRVKQLADGLTLGAGIDNHDVTPVASIRQKNSILELCQDAIDQGVDVLCGGQAASNLEGKIRRGYFVEPTVFTNVAPDSAIFQNEVFGPVLTITPFDSEDQAWELANATQYGLVAGIFTKDISRAMRGVKQLQAGQVFVNEWYAGGISTPFGGVKLSGFGREKGLEAVYGYVRTKNVAIRI